MIKKFDENFVKRRLYDYNKRKHLIILISLMVFALTFDIVTKILFTNQYYIIIEDVISIYYAKNYGAVMGSLYGQQAFLLSASIIVLSFIIYFYFRRDKKTLSFTIGMGFAFGGGIGNVVDRVFLGYVRDFVRLDCLPSFGSPIFNMADLFLTIGTIIMLYYFIFVAIRVPDKETRLEKFEINENNVEKTKQVKNKRNKTKNE